MSTVKADRSHQWLPKGLRTDCCDQLILSRRPLCDHCGGNPRYGQGPTDSPSAWMSRPWLHTGFAFTAAMPVLVLKMLVRNFLALVLQVFSDALLTFICP